MLCFSQAITQSLLENVMSNLIKSFDIPAEIRKKTNLGTTQFYEKLDIYDNKIVGLNKGKEEVSWFYKDV